MFNSWKSQVLVIVTLLLILGGIIGYAIYENNEMVSAKTVEEDIQTPTKITPVTEGVKVEKKVKNKEPFVVALLGTDERENEASRTDTIMLVRYDMETKEANMVSIPRDTKAYIEGHGIDKINAAHAYGEIPLALQTIEDLMDIKIDYYAKVNFEGFKEALNIIAPLEVDVKKKISYGGITIEKGLQELDVEELLTYVRFRKDADGDFGRIERQQEVVKLVINEMLKPKNLIKLPSIISVASEHIDTNFNWSELISLAKEATDFNSITFTSETLKTISEKENGIWYEHADTNDIYLKSNTLNGLKSKDPSQTEDLEGFVNEGSNVTENFSSNDFSSFNVSTDKK